MTRRRIAPDAARQVPTPTGLALSVIIPVYNEQDSLAELQARLQGVLPALGCTYEVLYIDDGSTDGSFAVLRELARRDPHVRVVRFRRNFGQTAAMAAGIDYARGSVLVFLDADLQNDPADIPRLVARLAEGYDVVSGWRRHRRDALLTRTLPSRLANWLISRVTGVHLHDYGCSLKAYRREVLDEVRLYGEMHRFVPAYAARVGARICEIEVQHHPRRHGASKYGLGRTLKVLLDLVTVKFLASFATKPIYLYGGMGALLIALSGVSGVAMVVQKLVRGVSMIQTPLLLLSAMLFILGVHSIMLGLLAELLVRTYHESQGKPIYIVREVLDGPPAETPGPLAARQASGISGADGSGAGRARGEHGGAPPSHHPTPG